jgi:aspergillopepsin I
MDFGFIDSTKYTGSITYTPVVAIKNAPTSGLWSFVSTGYAIGTRTFNTTSIPVLTDTGGNIVLLPQSMTLNFYQRVSGSYQQSDGSWAFPCATTLPTFTFGVGSSRIVVQSKFM